MPELPEVETIRKGLVLKIKNKKIKDVKVNVAKLFINSKKNVLNSKIVDVKRVGKILDLELANGYSILIHLKMTGQLVYKSCKDKSCRAHVGGHMQKAYGQEIPHKHTHIIYTFDDGSHLYFNDLRKFGWNRVVKKDEILKILGPDKFGPEPLSPTFSLKYLKTIFQKSPKRIKDILIDQKKISGLGNIYVNDALYWAGILPGRKVNSLSQKEIIKLKKAIEKVIILGLKYGGSSENTYVNVEGKRGQYMEYSAVYRQEKDPKGHLLKRQKYGSRSAFYCPMCQR